MHLISDFEHINFRKSEILIGPEIGEKSKAIALRKCPELWSRFFSKKLVFLVVYGVIIDT